MMSKNISELVMDKTIQIDETDTANLASIKQIQNYICKDFDGLEIKAADESHISELGELWANHAAIQHLSAPERYDFQFVQQDWRKFVKSKLDKKHHLLLVAQDKGQYEVKGFLYLQVITIPSSELILKGVIEDVYTKPQYRKQGIAKMLLETAIEWTMNNSIKHIDLITLVSAKGLSEFYSKFLQNPPTGTTLEVVTF